MICAVMSAGSGVFGFVWSGSCCLCRYANIKSAVLHVLTPATEEGAPEKNVFGPKWPDYGGKMSGLGTKTRPPRPP